MRSKASTGYGVGSDALTVVRFESTSKGARPNARILGLIMIRSAEAWYTAELLQPMSRLDKEPTRLPADMGSTKTGEGSIHPRNPIILNTCRRLLGEKH